MSLGLERENGTFSFKSERLEADFVSNESLPSINCLALIAHSSTVENVGKHPSSADRDIRKELIVL